MMTLPPYSDVFLARALEALDQRDPDLRNSALRRALREGLSVDARSYGRPLVWIAAKRGFADTIRLLAANHADLSAAAHGCGSTALHQAALNEDFGCVDMLLTLGANPGARDSGGRTPAEVARGEDVRLLIECAQMREGQAPGPSWPHEVEVAA